MPSYYLPGSLVVDYDHVVVAAMTPDPVNHADGPDARRSATHPVLKDLL
jgi:hypothetical protein